MSTHLLYTHTYSSSELNQLVPLTGTFSVWMSVVCWLWGRADFVVYLSLWPHIQTHSLWVLVVHLAPQHALAWGWQSSRPPCHAAHTKPVLVICTHKHARTPPLAYCQLSSTSLARRRTNSPLACDLNRHGLPGFWQNTASHTCLSGAAHTHTHTHTHTYHSPRQEELYHRRLVAP
jgi:hypothetical protein